MNFSHQSLKKVFLNGVLAIVILLSASKAVQAQGQPFLNLGLTSFYDGIPPAGPGIYLENYLVYYNANTFKDKSGNNVPNFPSVGLFVDAVQFIYMNGIRLPSDMNFGVDLLLPIMLANRGNPEGMGDLLFGPFLQWNPIMGKKGPIFAHRIELEMIFPTGKYSDQAAINMGSNIFYFDPYWAGTVIPVPGWEISTRLHYLWNGVNEDPNVFRFPGADSAQAGQAFHMNLATSYEVYPKRLHMGLNGYFLKQLNDSKVNGVSIPGSREQVLGVGAGALVIIGKNDSMFFNGYFETLARNRPEGSVLNVRYVHHFSLKKEAPEQTAANAFLDGFNKNN